MTARFYVLRMLEYDGLLQRGSPSKYCCWGCMKVHEQSDFSSKEFKKKVALKAGQSYLPEKKARRSCALDRYLWFGFRELSFTQLRHIIAHPDGQRRRDNGWIQLDRNDDWHLYNDFPSLEDKARWITYGLPLSKAQDITSYALFEQHASAVQIPLCPHLQVCDPKVIELYNDSSKLYHCEHCTTRVGISTTYHHVIVVVIRYLGLMRSPTDPVWLAQSYRARDKNLGPYCDKFLKWYRGQYGHIIFPRRFKRFRCKKKLLQPFEGVAFCPPVWPSAPYWD